MNMLADSLPKTNDQNKNDEFGRELATLYIFIVLKVFKLQSKTCID